MKPVKLSSARYRAFEALSRKDIATLKKHPRILVQSRELARACERVIKRLKAIPPHANRRKRETAYKRIVGICEKALAPLSK